MKSVLEIAECARTAALSLAEAPSERKNSALKKIAAALRAESSAIIAANAKDMAKAEESGLSKAMLERLSLSAAKI